MSKYGIVSFESTHNAIASEKALCGCFAVVLCPVPRSITASCGIALRFPLEQTDLIAAQLARLLPGGGYQIYAPFQEKL